jgi:hypothetical protein
VYHGATHKTRWFVLARVPHATVLIYYKYKCMDEDNILGYIDMRRVTSIREVDRVVTIDQSQSAMSGLMNKMKSMFRSHDPTEQAVRPVIELATAARTYVLCPASIDMPAPVSMAAASVPSIYGKPLFLFGWPFPVPPLEGAVIANIHGDGDDEHAIAASNEESTEAARRLLQTTDAAPVSIEC